MTSASFAPGSVRRIARDAKQASKGDVGIHYRHSSTCVTKAVAMIEGPEDTPYAGGFLPFCDRVSSRLSHRGHLN